MVRQGQTQARSQHVSFIYPSGNLEQLNPKDTAEIVLNAGAEPKAGVGMNQRAHEKRGQSGIECYLQAERVSEVYMGVRDLERGDMLIQY